MNKSLFEIERNYMELMQRIEESDGEVTEEIGDALAIAESERAEKGEAYIWVIKRAEANIQLRKDRIEQENKAIKREEAKIKRLQRSLYDAVKINGEFQAGPYRIKTKKTPAALVKPEDLDKTPRRYILPVRTTKIDFAAIKAAIIAGKRVRGYELKAGEKLSII